MGRKAAEKPQFLSEKLKFVRLNLGFTQEQMYEALRATGVQIHLGYVSLFETGERVPSLLVLLAYCRISAISMEILVDDVLKLPDTFLQKPK